jgi:S1-C subfamily serine protease
VQEDVTPVPEQPTEVPSPPRRTRTLALVSGLATAVVCGALVAGAVIGHEVWTRTAAPAVSNSTGFTPSGNSGFQGFGNGGFGNGGFGNANPGTGGAGTASAGSGAPAIASKVDPAIVDIDSDMGYEDDAGAGTGIVIGSNGEVLTNNHVIDGATKISATDLGNGKKYTATVVGYDPSHDVAVLQLQGASGLQTASLGDSSKVAVGDPVVGIGNAGGAGGTPTPAGGSVTALDASLTALDDIDGGSEQLSGMIQVNAPIEAGDSGGPLVNADGQVIGIDTAGSDSSGFSSYSSSNGSGYAIPIDEALTLAKQIESGQGSSTLHIGNTAFIGLTIMQSGGAFGAPSVNGLTVSGVLKGKPAQKAGLQQGDVITSVGGESVDSETNLTKLLLTHHPGDTIKLGWTDTAGQSHTATISLASGPPA